MTKLHSSSIQRRVIVWWGSNIKSNLKGMQFVEENRNYLLCLWNESAHLSWSKREKMRGRQAGLVCTQLLSRHLWQAMSIIWLDSTSLFERNPARNSPAMGTSFSLVPFIQDSQADSSQYQWIKPFSNVVRYCKFCVPFLWLEV